jgi:hypothetical protein
MKVRDDLGIATVFRGRLRHLMCYRNLLLSDQLWRLVDPRPLRSPHLNPLPQGEADASTAPVRVGALGANPDST